MTSYAPNAMLVTDLRDIAEKIQHTMSTVISGKDDKIRLALAVLLAEGHLLIEDVPGVGKTSLAKALAACIDGTVHRIQFTPDLLPSDVVGISIYNRHTQDFEFKPGPVFANIVVGDEINRASPKAQSALLECMEEQHVTVDGATYQLHSPFMVIATQNPIEMEGTYPLPEAQLDRFTARIEMGYPDPVAEHAMLDEHLDHANMGGANIRSGHALIDALKPICTAREITNLIQTVRGVHIEKSIKDYVIALVGATRRFPEVKLGASPRAALHLMRTARAVAAMDGREFVLPDDIQELAQPVLAHRLMLSSTGHPGNAPSAHQVISTLLSRVPIPPR
jgi:MoxR-like ATPase